MGISVSNGVIVEGELIVPYSFGHQKRDHEALILHYYGERCQDKCAICACCHMWNLFDSYWHLMLEVTDQN